MVSNVKKRAVCITAANIIKAGLIVIAVSGKKLRINNKTKGKFAPASSEIKGSAFLKLILLAVKNGITRPPIMEMSNTKPPQHRLPNRNRRKWWHTFNGGIGCKVRHNR